MKKRKQSWFSKFMLQLFGMNPPPKPDVPDVAPPVIVTPPPVVVPPPVPVANDFAGITKWYGAGRPDWPVTVQISNARIVGGNIQWDEDTSQRARWNIEGDGKKVNAENCFVVPSAGIAGRFDDCGQLQTRKTISNVLFLSAHEPGMFAPWTPKKGDRVGLYLTTLNSRREQFKMRERSNVTWFVWP